MQTLKDEFLGVYGTLRRRSLFSRGLLVSAKLRFFCSGQLRGKIFCQGSYPAAVQGVRILPGTGFRTLDPTLWAGPVGGQGWRFTRGQRFLFLREECRLVRPAF